MNKLFPKHLVGIEELDKQDILELVNLAKSFKEVLNQPVKSVPTLRGKTVVNLFFEPSTRTRVSFELAEKRLGCDVINFSASTSSLNKGESIKDTILNIEAMKIDAIVVRHSLVNIPRYISTFNSSSIINAGDGAHEHPTQALLDVFTMLEKFNSLEGKKILIAGDIKHSRVARSNIFALKKLNAHVRICAPATLLPEDPYILGVDEVYTDMNKAIEGVDIINNLRIQMERQKKGLFPSIKEYNDFFGLTYEKYKKIEGKVLIMHPGPINRGVEIDSKVADNKDSVILEQVTNGVAIRMAILYKLLGGKQ
jgi:aspartate carbamoyltransferase catalytic subunit